MQPSHFPVFSITRAWERLAFQGWEGDEENKVNMQRRNRRRNAVVADDGKTDVMRRTCCSDGIVATRSLRKLRQSCSILASMCRRSRCRTAQPTGANPDLLLSRLSWDLAIFLQWPLARYRTTCEGTSIFRAEGHWTLPSSTPDRFDPPASIAVAPDRSRLINVESSIPSQLPLPAACHATEAAEALASPRLAHSPTLLCFLHTFGDSTHCSVCRRYPITSV